MIRQVIKSHAGALALFAALAIGWTWPLVLHLGDSVPGDPGDNYSFLWNLWWMRHVLATPGLEYFHTSHLFYPFGTTIADHPHTALPALVAATVLKPLSIVAAQNLLLVTYVFANMATMYALVWTILSPTIKAESAEPAGNDTTRGFCAERRRQRRAAILAAVIFGLSPYLAVHLLGHFDLMAAWVLPAFALALRRAVHRGSNRAAVAAGLVLAATAYIAYYYVVYQCLFTIVYVLAWAVRVEAARAAGSPTPLARRLPLLFSCGAAAFAAVAIAIVLKGGTVMTIGPYTISARTPQNALTLFWLCAFGWMASTWRPRLRARWAAPSALPRAAAIVALVVAVFVVGASPLFWQAARLIARGEYVTPYYGWRSAPRGIDVLAPLLGHPLHPLFGAASERVYTAVQANYIEAIAWVGVLPLVLLVLTRRYGAVPEETRLWRIVGLAFLLWALGPFLLIGGFDTGLKLPAILARFVPFVANARMPGRAMVCVFMALGVLIGIGMSAVTGRLRAPAVQWLVIALVAFEYWDAPLRLTSLDHPPVYRTLAAAPPGSVCEVPFGVGDGLSGGVGSQDRRVLFYATQHAHPLAGGYIGRMPKGAAERYTRMPVAGALLQLSEGAPTAPSPEVANSPAPCRYLVVHRPASSAALLAYVEQLAADRIARDDARDLYRLR